MKSLCLILKSDISITFNYYYLRVCSLSCVFVFECTPTIMYAAGGQSSMSDGSRSIFGGWIYE